jgi:pre-rRNA-processing protein TSR3
MSLPHIYIIEHPKEKKYKCTVHVLKGREGLTFVERDDAVGRDWGDALLLHTEGETVLSAEDAGRPLILVDASWRWAERVARKIRVPRRRLPLFETAYPRTSKLFRDPPGGLASAEALFVASLCLGHFDETYLDGYRWKREFLETNRSVIDGLRFPGRGTA